MGYYPFGDSLFSDLTHYVRTGDFILALLRNAHNANELAFAAGALSHYVGDSIGHSEARDRAAARRFPKLAARYGASVNYAEAPHQHVQVEFAFDIDQIAKHRVAPLEYLRHIGLRVPTHQLALAFYETYGITDDFGTGAQHKFNAGEYQFATRKFIPRVAYAVTLMNRGHEVAELDTADAKEIEKVGRRGHAIRLGRLPQESRLRDASHRGHSLGAAQSGPAVDGRDQGPQRGR